MLSLAVLTSCSRPWAGAPTAEIPVLTPAAGDGQAPTSAKPTGANPTSAPGEGKPGSISLYSFRMVSAGIGWGMGAGSVLRSADGGKTWSEVTPSGLGKPDNLQVFAVNAQTAWTLVPVQGDLKRGSLYRTNDGGKTWTSTQAPFGGGYAQFLSAETIFFMADRGVAAGSQAVDIYRSGDAGGSWSQITHIDPQQPMDLGLPFSGNKTGVTFLDNTRGWVTGSIPMDGVSYFYATADGGKTWKQVQLALPAGLEKSQVNLDPPVFFGGVEGRLYARASGEPGALIFYASHDGGKTWSALTSLKYVGLVSIPTPNDLYVWDGGTLHASHDGGKSFQDLTPNINLTLKIAGFQFIDALNGWALGVEGSATRMFHSADGGKTWQ